MGLSDKDTIEEEEKQLRLMGIPTEVKPIDEQVSDFFKNKETELKKRTRIVIPKNRSSKKGELLEVKTWGFKDGILQHNMPCPVCMKNPASYETNEDGGYFAPCASCRSIGYVLKKENERKRGWFS